MIEVGETKPTPNQVANSLRQAAARLDVSPDFLRKRIETGELRALKFGRVLRILESDLLRFASAQSPARAAEKFVG